VESATLSKVVTLSRATVAYLDALGTSASTANPRSAKAFLGGLLAASEELARFLDAGAAVDHLHYQWFSDLLCLSSDSKQREGLRLLLVQTAKTIAVLATHGVFVRGGVALGQFYYSRNVAYGPALLEAVQTERETIQPRVALSPTAAAIIEGIFQDNLDPLPLVRDYRDGSIFVDYLRFVQGPQRRQIRGRIENWLIATRGAPQWHGKAQWMAAYYNWRTSATKPIPQGARAKFSFGLLTDD